VERKADSEEKAMDPKVINWVQLLDRVSENSRQLETLEQQVTTGSISFEKFFNELLSDGFTVPEAQELFTLLQA
jgi:hypothetical protein